MIGEQADRTHRSEYIAERHGVTPAEADEAPADPSRIVHHPDYNSKTGKADRVIGDSPTARDILTVIVLQDDGTAWGVNAGPANTRDRRIYRERNTDGR